MVNVKLPAVVGVPDNTPPAVRFIPGGRVPVCDHVIGAVPVAAKVKLYTVPTVPFGGAPEVIVGAIGAAAVAGNSHVSVTAFAFVFGDVFVIVALLVLIVPVKVAGNVCPVCAVNVTDAVYCVLAANGLLAGDHVTALILKLPVPVAVVLGAAPITGAVTFIAALFIGAGAVAANCHVSVTALPAVPGFVTFTVAVLPLIVPLKPVGNVNPPFAISVTLAVYCWLPVNGLLTGAHVTAPTAKLPVPVAVVLGATPVCGAVTVMAALVMVFAPVAGNTTVTVTVLPVATAGCETDVAPATVSVFAGSPLKLNPVFAVNVNTDVYTRLGPKFAPAAVPAVCVHVIAPAVVFVMAAVAAATDAPLAGAVAVIAPLVIGVAPAGTVTAVAGLAKLVPATA